MVWCKWATIQINPKKSSTLLIPPKIHSQVSDFKLSYHNSRIETQNNCKYLGVNHDFKLDFKFQIQQTETKVVGPVGILSKLYFLFPKSILLLLYYALIHPHLIFALPLWGSTFPTYLIKLNVFKIKQFQ